MPNLWRWISLLGLTWLFSQGFPKLAAREADESAPLRTVDEIHGLPPTEEIGRDVFVEIPAQVTYYSPKWPILFIHDGVTGMYVEAKRDFPFANGDQVVVRGRVGPGRYIVDASLEPNPGPPISLPKARRSEHKFLNGGHLDSQWVELEAWLVGLSEHVHHHRLEFRLNVTERFSALIDTSLVSEAYLTRWIREKIRVRGTVGAVVHPNGKFAGFQIWIRKIEDVELIRDESLPSPHSIENVSTLHRRNEDAPRSLEIAKVRGRAVRTVGQHGLFVRDESGVIFVESLRALTIQEGETVVAHGLLRGEPLRLEAARVDASLPVLEKLPSPELRDASELTTLPFDHSWVRTQGYVLESLRETEHVRLLLRSENTVFSAFVSGAEAAEVSAGTKVELTGVCVTRSALEHGHETFELYATPDGIRLLPSVPWELFATVAALAALVAGLSLLWARQLQHRVREQTDRIKEQFEQREVERKEFQERLLRSHKLESLGLLAGGIAHDFNNILQGILGNALLAQEVLGEASPAQENLDQIDKSSQRAADLTQQMLAYAGRGKFHIERVELSKLIESTTELIRSSLSKENGVEFELDSHLPLVEGDPSQLQQVVMNLLINASESMEGRPGTVHVQTETVFLDQKALSRFDVDETPAEGRFVCLSVTDRGTGMDAATLQRIFDPFYSTKFTGRGLGLAAVQGIVLRHGGAIRVESEFGRGSRFEVVLPAAGASSLETSESSESPGTRERLTPEVPSPSRGRRVLVVDDEPAVLRVALASLERHGYEVLDATDGDEAIQLCERELNSLDAVVLDLTLPRLNGLQVLDRIFALRQDVPVVVCSGYNETSLQESPHREKLAAFLHKPYLPTDLVSAVRRALSTNLEPRGLRELA